MEQFHNADAAYVVRSEYSSRKANYAAIATRSTRRGAMALAACIACTVLVLVVLLLRHNLDALIVALWPIPAVAAMWQIRTFTRYRQAAVDAAHRTVFYERGLERMDGKWLGTGNTGLDFARDRHPFQDDLDILGSGSLFELLATTRTEVGAERLAEYLLDSATGAEARARQESVRELKPELDLREEIDALGKYRFHNCSRGRLRGLLNEPPLRLPGAVSVLLGLFSLAIVITGAMGFARVIPWITLSPILGAALVGQCAIALVFMRRIRARIEMYRTLDADISVLRAGIELVAGLKFRSAKLCAILECLSGEGVARALRSLERILIAIERREDVILFALLAWIASGTQLVLAVERWRAKHQVMLECWLDAWAEFDTLSALAGYAYEHPEDVFPDLVDGGACFEACEMGHPLLPDCVRNDINLGESNRFYIVSGSNMAGKSTLLRAIGVNTVLAMAGAPVCARQARIGVMAVHAAITVGDSMREGASKFFAEVERLCRCVEKARDGVPVLFLVDEILAGTNSQDRCLAAKYMIDALIGAGAVGLLSTHDLALTKIAEREPSNGVNIHMQSRDADDPLNFDYLVRPGVATQTNGVAIVRMMGIQI